MMLRRAAPLFVLGLVAVGLASPVRAELAVTGRAPAGLEAEVASIEAFVDERMHEQPMAGVSVGFVHGGKAWARGFGYRDVEGKKPADADTSYRMASVTKIMTAVAVLQLAEQGKIDLDADIRKYVPSFPKKKYVVTVRALLGHLGGIAHYKDCSKECHFKTHKDTAQSLAVFKSWPLESEPGTAFLYTSYGYVLLGAAIEKVSGLAYGEYLKRHVFGPTGMTRSEVENKDALPKNHARGYRIQKEKLAPSEVVDISSRFSGGGTRSSVTDMLRLGDALLTHRLIKRETFDEMVVSMADAEGILTDYGLGVATYPVGGRLVSGHAGAQPETSSLLLTYPGSDLVVAVVCNVENQWPLLYAVAAKISETLLNHGIVRRGLAGSTLEEEVAGRVLTGVFGHGTAMYKARGRTLHESAGELLSAFETVNAHLDDDFIRRDPRAAYAVHRLGPGPKLGRAYAVAGAFMAAVLSSAYGPRHLEPYHVEGPLPFFVAYAETCRRIDCPVGVRLDERLVARLVERNDSWQRAYSDELKRLEIKKDADLEALARTFNRAFADAPMRPDFSGELIDLAERANKAKDPARAVAALTLARRLFAQNPKVAVALAEHYYGAGDLAAGDAAFKNAAALLGAEERLSPDRVKGKAASFRREGKHDAERAWLKSASVVHPEDTSILDMWARAAEKAGNIDDAVLALERAQAVAPSKRRASRLTRLKKAKAPPGGG